MKCNKTNADEPTVLFWMYSNSFLVMALSRGRLSAWGWGSCHCLGRKKKEQQVVEPLEIIKSFTKKSTAYVIGEAENSQKGSK